MDFLPYRLIPRVLPGEISVVSPEYIPPPVLPPLPEGQTHRRWPRAVNKTPHLGTYSAITETSKLIDKLGTMSGEAQGLKSAVTSAQRLSMSDDHIYIMRGPYDKAARQQFVKAVGFIRVGWRSLYLSDAVHGHFQQKHRVFCVLDFFVHPKCQRQGNGKKMFEFMLKCEDVEPYQLALDRPSSKFQAFMAKHYNLTNPIFQSNYFVIFKEFFGVSGAKADVQPGSDPSRGKDKAAPAEEQGAPDARRSTLRSMIADADKNPAKADESQRGDTNQCGVLRPPRRPGQAPARFGTILKPLGLRTSVSAQDADFGLLEAGTAGDSTLRRKQEQAIGGTSTKSQQAGDLGSHSAPPPPGTLRDRPRYPNDTAGSHGPHREHPVHRTPLLPPLKGKERRGPNIDQRLGDREEDQTSSLSLAMQPPELRRSAPGKLPPVSHQNDHVSDPVLHSRLLMGRQGHLPSSSAAELPHRYTGTASKWDESLISAMSRGRTLNVRR
eukprot:scpid58129/ scgid2651/ Alpha-tubulin N-acetyltransferase; Acetyltransferase mec-17 homolog